MTIIRTEDGITRLANWAVEGVDNGTHYAGQSYEEGILDALEWLQNPGALAPHEDE